MVWFYREQGFSVIPLKEKDKKPNIPSWLEYSKEKPQPSEIQKWLDAGLFQNVGIVCGAVSNNLVVIDIDDKNIITELNISIEKITQEGYWIVETGKGFHIYAKHKEDPGNLTKDDKLHIEYRANGGYVVAPPSIHPSGKQYVFLNKSLDPLKEKDARSIFDNWVKALQEKHGTMVKAKEPTPTENIEADCVKNVFKGGLTQGKRNDTAYCLANWYRDVKKLNPTEIRALVHNWNQRNKEPLPDGELSSIITSALKSKKSTGCNRWKQLGFCPHEEKKDCSFLSSNKQINKESQLPPNTPNTPNTPNRPNRPNRPNISRSDNRINYLLEKEKRPFQSIGRGLNKGLCYIGSYIEDDGGTPRDAVITSDRKIYVDWGKMKDEIREDFELNYRDSFFYDILDSCWSNESIKKWLFENYNVDIKDIYTRLLKINKKFMKYEDERNHIYTAVDIMRSYFFHLFDANSRTHHLAEPGAGKTNQAMIYRALSFNPVASPDFSSASIYRNIESTGGTIIIDDFDDLPEEEKQRIRRHIKVNYKPFKAIRSDGGGKKFRPQGYNAYSHLIFNNVEGLGYDDITSQRVITIRLLKHRDAEDITVNYQDLLFKPIRDDLYVCLLQYWKEIKESYDSLKIPELRARDLEIFKPLLAISKVIGEDVYELILSFAKEYLEQANITDLEDNWEFLLYKYLWAHTEDLDENDTKQTRDFSPQIIASEIAGSQYKNLDQENMSKRVCQLRSFIGGKLTNAVLFKKTSPNNRVEYHVNRKGLKQILETKQWLGLLGLLGQLPPNRPNRLFDENEEQQEKTSQFDKIMEVKAYIEQYNTKGHDGISWAALTDHFNETLLYHLKESGQLFNIPGTELYRWGG
jgi:hypothetical protein